MTAATLDPQQGTERDGIDWAGAVAAIASIGAVGLALGLGLPLLSVVLENRGISTTMIGLNTAVAGIASLLAAPAVTPMAWRFGVRGTMFLAIGTAAAAAVGFHFFQPFWTWFPLRLVFHFSVTVMFILSEFWIGSVTPARRRGLMLGIYATVLALGFAVGPFLFSVVGSRGFLPFGLGAGIILLSALPILFARRSEPVLDSGHQAPFHRYLWAVPSATGAVLVFGAVESGGLALFPIYGLSIGFSEGGAARLLTAVGLGSVALQIPLGLLSDRVRDRRHLLLAFAAIGLAGSLLLPHLETNWVLLAAVLFVWGGVVAGLYTVGLAHLGSRLRGADLAAANAAFIFCYSLGMLVGPQTLGVSMDLFGAKGFAYALAAFFLAYLAGIGARTLRRPS